MVQDDSDEVRRRYYERASETERDQYRAEWLNLEERERALEAKKRAEEANIARRHRASVVANGVAYASAVVGSALIILSASFPKLSFPVLGGEGRSFLFGVGGFFVILGVFNIILLYLNGRLRLPLKLTAISFQDGVRSTPSAGVDPRFDAVMRRLDVLQKAQISATTGTKHEDVVAALLPLVQTSMGEVLTKKFAQQALENDRVGSVRKAFGTAETRLALELDSLRKRANLNLAIGAATTVVAIALLYWLVLGSERTFENLYAVLSHYIPRISIVVFIEIFAFFFLRLYRATLDEIRGYQADVTRLNLQYISVEMAWADESATARRGFAEALLAANGHPANVANPESDIDQKAITALLEKLAKLLPAKETK